MAGALVSHSGSSAVDVISHVSTQPHDHLAGSADSYQERRDPDPVGKGKRWECSTLGCGDLGRQLDPSAHKQHPQPKLVSHHGGWFCEPQTSSPP